MGVRKIGLKIVWIDFNNVVGFDTLTVIEVVWFKESYDWYCQNDIVFGGLNWYLWLIKSVNRNTL